MSNILERLYSILADVAVETSLSRDLTRSKALCDLMYKIMEAIRMIEDKKL